MEIITKKQIDQLTEFGVSIRTQQFVNIDGKLAQVGDTHRCSYANSIYGRDKLIKDEPENISKSVLVIWGDNPTVEDPEFRAD